MSTVSASMNPDKGRRQPLVPPEETIWKKYSSHYEFPISSVSSLFMHVAVLGMLFLIWAMFLKWFPEEGSLPIEQVVVPGGGGGNPDGIGIGPGNGSLPKPREAVDRAPTPSQGLTDVPPNQFQTPTAQLPPLISPKDQADPARTILQQADAASSQMAAVRNTADDKLKRALAGKGKGGTGSGGGEGSGVGTGTGPGAGPGSAGSITQRQKRQQRWVLIFDVRSVNFATQLHDLGAILAAPREDGEYVVYRDLNQRPVQGKVEDLSQLNRIFWTFDSESSIKALCTVLGITPVPRQIVAFFPESLERELLEKEMAYFRGKDENLIDETFFRVERRGNRYEPVVSRQTRKAGAR